MNKRLRKSFTDRKISGVCGGLAEHFGIDSTIVRVLFLAGLLLGGGALLVYLLFWVVMPD